MPITLNPNANPSPSVDLISSAYLSSAFAAAGITVTPAIAAVQATLISAASEEIIRYCGNRPFRAADYDEIVLPIGGRENRGEPATAQLRHFPVNRVARVLGGRVPALTVVNNDPVTNQEAYVSLATSGDPDYQLTCTGVVLTTVASAVETTITLLFATYPTLGQLAAAVNTAGQGWGAALVGSIGTSTNVAAHASAQLVGAREPKPGFAPGASLSIFSTPLASVSVNRRTGVLSLATGSLSGMGWGGVGAPGWEPGDTYDCDNLGTYQQVRVRYNAGYATVPQKIQEVCVNVVKNMLDRLKLRGALKSESVEDYAWVARDVVKSLPDDLMLELDRYKATWL